MADLADDSASLPPSASTPKPHHHYHRTRALWTLLLVLGLQNMSVRLMNLPLNRVIELRYCQTFYHEHDPSVIGSDGSIPEQLCKLDSIQQRLAWLQGAVETLHVICDLLVTIPYGAISDHGHRKTILCLNVCGLSLMYLWLVIIGSAGAALPVSAMLAAPLFSLLGGGDCVFMSTVAALVTEISGDATQRATWFAYISSVSYVVTLLAPSVAAVTMSWMLWLPFWIGIAMLLLAMPLILSIQLQSDGNSHSAGDDEPEAESLLQRSSIDIKRERQSDRGIIKAMTDTARTVLSVLGRANFRLLLLVFLLASLASSNTPLLPQYISKRYGWTFAQAGYLLSVKAAVNIVLLTVIVPYGIKLLARKTAMSGTRINVTAANTSLIVSVLGALMVAMAFEIWQLIPSFFIYAAGSALPVFTMSLVKSPAISGNDNEANAQDYSIVMLARTIGTLLGLPLMTVAWAKGIGMGGFAMGALYFLSAAFYLLDCFCIRALGRRIS